YHEQYWLPSRAEQMPLGFGEVLFDIKVNGGDGPKMLQRALNRVIGGTPLKVDGALGLKSIAAMNATGKHGLISFLTVRQERYNELAKRPNFRQFLAGWTNRNNDLSRFALALI
ncbi:MAG: putative peptidoglycan-binding domain-containing protein, partial [Prosthecobacter sp.]|nr:putative peptidoglycan-binding domain-containing protein [Prosthecobacter sp.]